MKERMQYFDRGLRHFIYCLFISTMLMILIAFISTDNNRAEANMGNFEVSDFNSGWVFVGEKAGETLELPTTLHCSSGEKVVIKNTLPDNLSDGMSLMVHTYMEDVYIYIDGILRENYASSDFDKMTYYLPSEYVVTSVDKNDASKEIRIEYTVKEKGIINEVELCYGNNAWFPVIKNNIVLFIFSLFVVVIGVIVVLFYSVFKRQMNMSKSLLYLGMLMTMMGSWMLSESNLRQFLYARPSLTSLFSYFTIDLMGILVVLYFDEVQHHIYHKIYYSIVALSSIKVVVTIVISYLGLAEFHDLLVVNHILFIGGMIVTIINIIRDIRSKNVRSYRIIAFGMGLFLLFAQVEIISFYISNYQEFGIFVCIGIILLMLATVTQVIFDEAELNKSMARSQQDSWIAAIETVASAIDAKDEYTGGHSNRVAEYAGILAREMAADYDFSEYDILQIKYIGLMHDIGKIGVADTILNKAGRLTDEEFTLMKKHVEIGFDLMKPLNGDMENLLNGIRHHHERFDGKGYPDGLEGTDIPLIARILCLADCYDAMTSNRVYRKRLSDEEVRAEILRCAGTQFDPALADIFVRIMNRGDMSPVTKMGMAVNSDGTILKSSMLEERLQSDLLQGISIKNPSHVRMICYVIKLAEQNNRSFDMFMAKTKDGSDVGDKFKPHIRNRDISIEYTDAYNIFVLFDRSKEELEKLLSSFSEAVDITFI